MNAIGRPRVRTRCTTSWSRSATPYTHTHTLPVCWLFSGCLWINWLPRVYFIQVGSLMCQSNTQRNSKLINPPHKTWFQKWFTQTDKDSTCVSSIFFSRVTPGWPGLPKENIWRYLKQVFTGQILNQQSHRTEWNSEQQRNHRIIITNWPHPHCFQLLECTKPQLTATVFHKVVQLHKAT